MLIISAGRIDDAGGAVAQSLAGRSYVLQPTATGRFGVELRAVVPIDAAATALRWLTTSTSIIAFAPHDFDATSNGAIERATLTASGDGVRVRLPTPRKVTRLRVDHAQSDDRIAVFRTDGEQVTEDAFASGEHGAAGASFDFVDREFVLRTLQPTGAGRPTAVARLRDVRIDSAPVNVRVGVRIADASEVFYLAGDANPLFAAPTSAVDLGPALVGLLEDGFTRAFGDVVLPAASSLSLVLESDSPARVGFSAFALGYRFVQSRFADGADKRVFSFAGGALQRHPLILELPATANIAALELTANGDFRDAAVAGADAPPPPPMAPSTTSADSASGVRLAAGDAAASRYAVTTPALVSAVVLRGIALANAHGRLRWRADASDQPSVVLAEGRWQCSTIGDLSVLHVSFADALVLAATNYWIELQCDEGVLLWSLAPDAGGRTLRRGPAARQATARPAPEFEELIAAAGHRGDAVPVLSGAAAANGSQVDPLAFAGVRVDAGGQRLVGELIDTNRLTTRRFDLRPLLSAAVTADGARTLAVTFAAHERAVVTVYPPLLEYG